MHMRGVRQDMQHCLLFVAPTSRQIKSTLANPEQHGNWWLEDPDAVRWREHPGSRGGAASANVNAGADTGTVAIAWPAIYEGGKIDRHSMAVMSADEEATLAAYYEHSFAVSEDTESRVAAVLGLTDSFLTDSGLFCCSGSDSLESPKTGETKGAEPKTPSPPAMRLPLPGRYEDLATLRRVHNWVGRGMLVNVIAAVLTVSQRRRVRTRYGGEVDVVEILMGDETDSGFRVTCWLPTGQSTDLAASVDGLHARDIVYVRAMAPSEFRGRRSGQSVRGLTRIDVLHRAGGGGLYSAQALEQEGGESKGEEESNEKEATQASTRRARDWTRGTDQTAKVRRVRDWVVDFVSPVVGAGPLVPPYSP